MLFRAGLLALSLLVAASSLAQAAPLASNLAAAIEAAVIAVDSATSTEQVPMLNELTEALLTLGREFTTAAEASSVSWELPGALLSLQTTIAAEQVAQRWPALAEAVAAEAKGGEGEDAAATRVRLASVAHTMVKAHLALIAAVKREGERADRTSSPEPLRPVNAEEMLLPAAVEDAIANVDSKPIAAAALATSLLVFGREFTAAAEAAAAENGDGTAQGTTTPFGATFEAAVADAATASPALAKAVSAAASKTEYGPSAQSERIRLATHAHYLIQAHLALTNALATVRAQAAAAAAAEATVEAPAEVEMKTETAESDAAAREIAEVKVEDKVEDKVVSYAASLAEGNVEEAAAKAAANSVPTSVMGSTDLATAKAAAAKATSTFPVPASLPTAAPKTLPPVPDFGKLEAQTAESKDDGKQSFGLGSLWKTLGDSLSSFLGLEEDDTVDAEERNEIDVDEEFPIVSMKNRLR